MIRILCIGDVVGRDGTDYLSAGGRLMKLRQQYGADLVIVNGENSADGNGMDVNYCFDRKEIKDHGEGGMFVGKNLENGEKVVIIEDVMTSGKALREVLPKLTGAADIDLQGMVITVDRMEKGLTSDKSAVQEVYEEFGVKVYSIVTINDIIDALEKGVIPGAEYVDKMKEYRKTYGVG
ncbi:MAG: YmdB family metallophosphoesterase [Oscillospiraceae bacterium]|nr:YmdB family metallophosphoesterase [Oscillospiraceae bacterium]